LAAGKPFPTTVVMGSDAFKAAKEALKKDEENLEEWKDMTLSTDFDI